MTTNDSESKADEVVEALKQALVSEDENVRQAALVGVIDSSRQFETVVLVPLLLRALALDIQPQDKVIEALRSLGLGRVAKLLERHMPELLEIAHKKIDRARQDHHHDDDELPALGG